MKKMVFEKKEKAFGFGLGFVSLSPSQAPPSIPSSQSSANYGLNNRISPSVLLIIIIIAVIFFISGLLHLLVRFLVRPPAIRNSDEIENLSGALQGQLQQLFHLHDSGVDQSFIDTLPVFNYKAIVGVKDPFDCAVCLSEFEVEDELRLLPKCSHAFHVDCIDTWLLSHSTCPICRGNLVQDSNHAASPVVRALESQDSRELIVEERQVDREIGDRVVEVKLGKFRNVGGGGGGGEGGAEARRCFSMGSFAYVLKEDSSLKVAITDRVKKKRGLGVHRTAMSECGCESRREFNGGFEAFKVVGAQSGGGDNDSDRSSVCMSKRESFSWLRSGRKDQKAVDELDFEFDEEIGNVQTQNRLLHHTTFSSNV